MDSKYHKWLLAALITTTLSLFALGGYKLVVHGAAREAIRMLQKDYTPFPYGPSIDPDKVNPTRIDPNALRTMFMELQQNRDATSTATEQQWRHNWEQEREGR